jgi:hypothetical protein
VWCKHLKDREVLELSNGGRLSCPTCETFVLAHAREFTLHEHGVNHARVVDRCPRPVTHEERGAVDYSRSERASA